MAHHQRAERNIFCIQVVVCTFPLGNPQAHSSNAQLIRGFKFQFICSNSIAADFQSYLPIHLKYLVWDPIICMHFSDTWWILVHTHTPHPGVYKMTFWRIIILIKNSSNFRKKNSPFEPILEHAQLLSKLCHFVPFLKKILLIWISYEKWKWKVPFLSEIF